MVMGFVNSRKAMLLTYAKRGTLVMLIALITMVSERGVTLAQNQDTVQSQPATEKKPSAPESALDRALKDLGISQEQAVTSAPSPRVDFLSRQVGGARLRLIDISLDALFAAGGSTESDESLQSLQGSGHDPRKRGFTVQNVELSFTGAVDPYFTAEAHFIYFLDPLEGESIFELEEVFLTTQSLPYGLQLEAGQFFTEFGRINPRHPHQWHWEDQPIINTRLFGPDGMRGPGFRLGWLTPLSWFSQLHFGMQNANGETMASFLASEEFFEERPIGGRPFVEREVDNLDDLVYLIRWDNSWNVSDEITTGFGFSGIFGPNASGPDGRTRIYGADFILKQRPVSHFRGWPFIIVESEIMKRDYDADPFFDDSDPDNIIDLAGETLRDWGLYIQLLYGFRYRWATGLRYEYVSGSEESVEGREADPFRNDRYRISPLLAWYPSEFSRIRLQYNYDHADHLEDENAHSVWLGFEFLYGAHPAHTF